MKLNHWILFLILCNCCFIQADKPDSIFIQKHLKAVMISKIKNNRNSITITPDSLIQNNNSLNDILTFLPSFESDMEGNIRLRGSDKVTFLINGRPTSLLGDYRNEMLIQLPVQAIRDIKTDYIPDVTQRQEGSAGIINILLTEPLPDFPTRQIYLSTANNNRYSAGVHASFTPFSCTKLYANIDYKREYRKRIFQNTLTTYENGIVTNQQFQDNSAIAHPQTILGTIGGIFKKEKHTVNIDLSFIQMWFDRTGNIYNSETLKEMQVVRDNEQTNRQYNGAISYRYKINTHSSISTDFSYRRSTYDENNDYQRDFSRPKPNLIQDKLFINQKNNEYEFNFGGNFGAFKTGYNIWITTSGNTNLKEVKNGGNYTESPSATFNIDLNRDIHSLFLQYDKQWDKWQLSAGLRGEYAHQSVYLTNSNSRIRQDSWNIFPALFFSYNNDRPGHSWHLSYQERTNRPSFSELNPFLNQSDPQETTQGNPYLKPEISHNLTLGYSYIHPVISFTPNLFYRNKKRTIARITQDNNVVTAENLHNTQTAGVEISINITPISWMNIRLNGTAYYDEIQADKKEGKRSDWAYNANGVITLRLSPTTLLQCNGLYISNLQTVQGSIRSRYQINTGIKQNIFAGKGEVTLQINDWLGSAKEITIIDTPTLYKKTEKQRDSRTAWLGIAWNFNMNKQNNNKLN